jgi:hypothetical protein
MQVKCVINDISQLSSVELTTRLKASIKLDGADRDLKVGALYEVQAIENINGYLWYYIQTVEKNSYPFPYPAEFFLLVDASLPRKWVINFTEKNGSVAFKRLAIQQWADSDVFYEQLVDDDPDVQRLYNASLTNPA